ncbi:hypothetical protein BDZ91DRAFT_731642 [Kalaharituber pfeilii]|nr:hypothetical protein BDZ91DRAFT_731642 [Kalaharituber pfeilii]
MDTQHSNHGSQYAYSIPGYSDFYDVWVESLFSPANPTDSTSTLVKSEDTPLFSELLQQQLDLASNSERQTVSVVDLGTGTGRVVQELWRSVIQSASGAQENAPNIELYGVDHSTDMIRTAERTFIAAFPETERPSSKQPSPRWLQASASNFVEKIGGVEGKIDLLLLSVGMIHHLIDPAEILALVGQIAKGLRAGTGVAAIAVLDEMVPENQEAVNVQPEYTADLIIPVKKTSGAVYCKSPTVTKEELRVHTVPSSGEGQEETKVQMKVRTDSWVVELFEGVPADWNKEKESLASIVEQGKASKVWRKEMEWSLAVWDEPLFIELLRRNGLEITETKKGGYQKWYLLRRT